MILLLLLSLFCSPIPTLPETQAAKGIWKFVPTFQKAVMVLTSVDFSFYLFDRFLSTAKTGVTYDFVSPAPGRAESHEVGENLNIELSGSGSAMSWLKVTLDLTCPNYSSNLFKGYFTKLFKIPKLTLGTNLLRTNLTLPITKEMKGECKLTMITDSLNPENKNVNWNRLTKDVKFSIKDKTTSSSEVKTPSKLNILQ